jgi:hypothetical protein
MTQSLPRPKKSLRNLQLEEHGIGFSQQKLPQMHKSQHRKMKQKGIIPPSKANNE